MINIPAALWGDVFPCGEGVFGCTYDLGHNIVVEYAAFNGAEVVSTGRMDVFGFTEKILYVRGAMNGFRDVLVMGQGQDTGRFRADNLHGAFAVPTISTYGTHTCALVPTQDKFYYSVQTSQTSYYNSFTNTFKPIPIEIHGTSQGIIQLWNGEPIWADLVRASIPEMFFPMRVNDVYIGEGRTDPAHIQALEGTVQKNIFYGEAARPRCAYDLDSNILAVASRGGNGVTFNFFSRPLTDVSVVIPPIEPEPEPPPVIEPEPPPMACTPVVPPQNYIADSTNALRNFCQTYVVPPTGNNPAYPPGSMPYKADTIQENGLFLADGLVYFMMSDTGLWAKILMNPDDKRDWNTKRQAADAALFDYMRRRVGDVPVQTMPGGALSGDVNV